MGNHSHTKMVTTAESPDGFKSKTIFEEIENALKQEGETLVGKVNGIYSFKVKGGPNGSLGNWIVDAKNGTGKGEFNGTDKADVTLTMSDQDLLDLMTGKLNSQKAFFQGKLKVQGNMGLAMKLQEFQKKKPKSKL